MQQKIDKIFLYSALGYLILPILLFTSLWLAWYVCLPMVAFFIVCTVRVLFGKNKTEFKDIEPEDKFAIKLLLIFLVAIVWVTVSGIGGLGFQNNDLHWRNVIFKDLVRMDWPVIYTTAGGFDIMCYYLVYWLPPALFGKITGSLQLANLALYLWTILGVFLVLYLFVRNLRKIKLIYLLIFVFFSGMDIVLYMIRYLELPVVGKHIETAFVIQFSSLTTTLFWVFNQTIVPWIIMMLLLATKNNKSTVFFFSLCLPAAPLPCLGLFPIAAVMVVTGRPVSFGTKGFKKRLAALWSNIRSAITIQNLLVPVALLFIFYQYYSLNSRTDDFTMFLDIFSRKRILFIVFEFAILSCLIFPMFYKKPLYWTINATLLFIALYEGSMKLDFIMRASIPAVLLLCFYTVLFLKSRPPSVSKVRLASVIVVLIIGAVTPANEIFRSLHYMTFDKSKLISDKFNSIADDPGNSVFANFVGINSQDSFFYKYLAKK